jgi:hypothetical protein
MLDRGRQGATGWRTDQLHGVAKKKKKEKKISLPNQAKQRNPKSNDQPQQRDPRVLDATLLSLT